MAESSSRSRSRSREREPSRSRSHSRDLGAQPASSVKWVYTSYKRRDKQSSSDDVIRSEDFATQEEAESYACRMVITKLRWIAELKDAERAILEASPEKLMDYGWMCDTVKKEKWFAGRNDFETFTWTIKKKHLTGIDVNDGWHLDIWKKLEERRLERAQADRLDEERGQSYSRLEALWPKDYRHCW